MSFLTGQCGGQPFSCTPISTCPVMAPKPTRKRRCNKLTKFLHWRPGTPQPTKSSIDIAATQPPTTPLALELTSSVGPPVLNPHDTVEPTSTKLEKVFAKAPKPTRNCRCNKLMKFLHWRPGTPQPTESSIDIAATKPEKVFTKGKSFKRDMAILSIAYILQESPELKRLIHLIVVIRDNDSEGQVMSAMYHAYRSLTVLSCSSLPKFSKPALGSVFNLHLLPMPSVQKPHRR